ncbi:hypothetical protein [Nitrosopumilus piranensis]|nr:hypothetical protein [Nitrosopumilus piranensis]
MTKTTVLTIFSALILFAGTSMAFELLPQAEALKGQGVPSAKFGIGTKGVVCGDKLCSEVEKEQPKKVKKESTEPKKKEEVKTEPKKKEVKTETKPTDPTKKESIKTEKKDSEKDKIAQKTAAEKQRYDELTLPPRTIVTKTITSMQDSGLGHENHQLAIIFPPSDKVYRGMLTYVASEPVQLVALHGPLAPGEEQGQAIWSPDGETKFALTFIPKNTAAGTWHFAGNAIAVHTMNEEPFTISYTAAYRERALSNVVKSETITSSQDPGLGHENHQIAVLLPPRDRAYFGTLGFAASEPVQLVALHGPLQPGQEQGQAIWSPDGETKFGLTFIDKDTSSGTWQFAGHAIAVHTMNQEPFTISYSIATGQ